MADEDPYVYPGTTVLRNHFGIRDAAVLAEREAAHTVIRIAELEVPEVRVVSRLSPILSAFSPRASAPTARPGSGQTKTSLIAESPAGKPTARCHCHATRVAA
jgi:hypothetical protein